MAGIAPFISRLSPLPALAVLLVVGALRPPPGGAQDAPSERSDVLSVFDTGTGALIATVPVGQLPVGLAVANDGTRIYVSNRDSGTISVVGGASDTVVATLPFSGVPEALSLLPDGSRLYIADRRNDRVGVLDTATQTIVASVSLDGIPESLATAPDGSTVYVGISSPDAVDQLDPTTDLVTTSVALDEAPQSLAASADGGRLYFTTYNTRSRRGGALEDLDIANGTAARELTFSSVVPQRLIVAPDATRGFVTHIGILGLSIVDLVDAHITTELPLDSLPAGLALAPDTSRLYAAVGIAPSHLLTLDARSGQVVADFPLSGTAQDVAVAPDGSRVYVVHRADGQ